MFHTAIALSMLFGSSDIAILRAALIGRVEMGYMPSVGGELRPFSGLCVGRLDGKDLPDAVLKAARSKTLHVYPLSRCPSEVAATEHVLRLGKVRKTSRSRAEVQWYGLGNAGVMAVCRETHGWRACGLASPLVGHQGVTVPALGGMG
jgi:hypothetical protein